LTYSFPGFRRGDAVEITRQYKEKKDAFVRIRKEVLQLKKFGLVSVFYP